MMSALLLYTILCYVAGAGRWFIYHDATNPEHRPTLSEVLASPLVIPTLMVHVHIIKRFT